MDDNAAVLRLPEKRCLNCGRRLHRHGGRAAHDIKAVEQQALVVGMSDTVEKPVYLAREVDHLAVPARVGDDPGVARVLSRYRRGQVFDEVASEGLGAVEDAPQDLTVFQRRDFELLPGLRRDTSQVQLHLPSLLRVEMAVQAVHLTVQQEETVVESYDDRMFALQTDVRPGRVDDRLEFAAQHRLQRKAPPVAANLVV